MWVYIVKLPPDTLPPWRQFGWRQCDLRTIMLQISCQSIHAFLPISLDKKSNCANIFIYSLSFVNLYIPQR